MLRKSVIVSTVIIRFLITTSVRADSPWPMFRHDLRHTGSTRYTGPAEPAVLWTFSAKDGIASSPAIGEDGTVYVGAGWDFRGVTDAALYAVNPDGTLKWRYPTGDGVFSSPAIGPDGVIFVGCLDGNLYAVDDRGADGVLKWKTLLNNWVYSSPAVLSDGSLVVGGVDFNVYSLYPNGTVRWAYTTDWCVFSSPAVGNDETVYIGSKDEHLYAFDPVDGFKWKAPTGSFYDGHLVDSSPAVGADGTIYVGTDPYGAMGQTPVPVETVFFAFRPDGTLKWTFDMEDGAESSPAIGHDGTIYIGSYDGRLYAIEDTGSEGVLKWSFSTGGQIDCSPAVDGCGTVYIGSRDSTLYAIQPDGELLWSLKTGGGIESSPAIDDRGILYVGSFDGSLYAVGTPGPDAGLADTYLIVPKDTPGGYIPAVYVRNYRRYPVSFDVTVTIKSGSKIVYESAGSVADLGDGGDTIVELPPWNRGDNDGDITITAAVVHDGDTNPANDSLVRILKQDGSVGVVDSDRPSPITLETPYPNPFNSETVISYAVSPTGNSGSDGFNVSLIVYDLRGAVVRRLADGLHRQGVNRVTWDGTNDVGEPVASGVYIIRLASGQSSRVVRVSFVK